MARGIDGEEKAAKIVAEIAVEVLQLKAGGISPGIALVLVGEDPASKVYIGIKEKACIDCGIFTREYKLPTETDQADLLALIGRLNRDPRIHGILVQLPLPGQIDTELVLQAISPAKVVDGSRMAEAEESGPQEGAEGSASGRGGAAGTSGGVGPTTIAILLRNTVAAARRAERAGNIQG